MNTETNATIDDLAHEAWAAAQLAPGEGIEDAVRRIAGLIAALKEDAERYRWLKSRPTTVPTEGPDLALWSDCCGDALRDDEADNAIDAAMKKGA